MKSLPKPLRYGLITLILLAAISMAIFGARRAWPSSAASVLPLMVVVQPRDFTLKINASGELQSAESMAIAVPFVPVQRLRIASVIADGRHVSKGDMVIEFDETELDLEMLEHRSSLEAADQKITKGELATGVEKTDIIKD